MTPMITFSKLELPFLSGTFEIIWLVLRTDLSAASQKLHYLKN